MRLGSSSFGARARRHSRPRSIGGEAGMGFEVLIVEDDRDLARNLVDYLQLQGYVVDYAPDALLAMHLLGEND